MRVWFDVVTPKHALFTKALLERAPSDIECEVTTRNYSELSAFVRQLGLPHTSIGRFGGGPLGEKLDASVKREIELVDFLWRGNFDFSISSNSPEASRMSFKMGISHYIYGDSPHGRAPNRLASPLATLLFTPFAVPKRHWTEFGLRSNQVIQYRALDPWCWLMSRKDMLREKVRLKRSRRKLSIMVRLEEWFASYMRKGRGISKALDELLSAIERSTDSEITLVPRYEDQRRWAKDQFGNRCIVPDTTIHGAELISEMDLVIGGGGTMTQEAALIGVPNISYFPSAKLDVFERFYFPRKLSVKALTTRELLSRTKSILREIETERKQFFVRAVRETERFEDPASVMFENILTRGR